MLNVPLTVADPLVIVSVPLPPFWLLRPISSQLQASVPPATTALLVLPYMPSMKPLQMALVPEEISSWVPSFQFAAPVLLSLGMVLPCQFPGLLQR